MKQITIFLFFLLFVGLQTAVSQTKPAPQSPIELFAMDKVQDVKITFKQSNWSYYLDSLRFNGDGLMPAVVELNGQKFENAGVRYRGFKSFAPGMPRNPLHIVLNTKDKTQTYQGYSTLKLSNTLRDPSMLREVLGYEIARTYMPAPKANFAKVTINGKIYGLLANVESVNEEQFMNRYFASSDNGRKAPPGAVTVISRSRANSRSASFRRRVTAKRRSPSQINVASLPASAVSITS